MPVTARRLSDQPIICPGVDARMGDNINGPSIIKMPSWVASPLGRYHLYFADHKGRYIRLAYPNVVLRSRDGLRDFEAGPAPLDPASRHGAALPQGHVLHVVWTRLGDAPERNFHGTIDLAEDWRDWRLSEPTEVLRPERRWEGGDLPLKPSAAGAAEAPVNELRDPCLFEDSARVFLLYSGAGEGAIGIAELNGI